MMNPTMNLSNLNLNLNFLIYRCSSRALSCIIFAFDILRTKSKTFKKEQETQIKNWVLLYCNKKILFYLKQMGSEEQIINNIHDKLKESYSNFDKLKNIEHNIIKFHILKFDD